MKLWSIRGNSQKLDGGAMFGNAPKVVWSRWIAPDERNRIPLACRAMLLQAPDGRLILCETGIGAFFPPKLRDRFGVQETEHVLLQNLAAAGFTDADVDVVVLSHLHFDHAGGLLDAFDPEVPARRLLFPKARFVVGRDAWSRAKHRTPATAPRSSPSFNLCSSPAAASRSSKANGLRSSARASASTSATGTPPV